MARRYSDDAVVNVTRSDEYDAYKATVSMDGHNVWSGWVGAPASLRYAVDSPEAYDSAASAALSFADEETGGWISDRVSYKGHGWDLSRQKPGARQRPRTARVSAVRRWDR